jgi:hypothetical protein
MLRLLALTFTMNVTLLACGPKPPPTDTTGSGDGTGTATPVEPVIDTAALGTPCSDEGTCQPGASCLSYFGIAGPSGPEFSSCEIPCTGKGDACPDGTKCITIADGPGEVCRTADAVAE